MTRLSITALALAVLLASLPPALAAEDSDDETMSELAREGVATLMRALEALIDEIPQYELPEINQDGDIIIRRKRKDQAAPPIEPELTRQASKRH